MKNLVGFIIIVLIWSSCVPSSRITGSWKKPKFKGSYSDVMITALTPGIDARTTIENDLAAALTSRGVLVTKSMDIFPPNFSKETRKEEMMRKIRRTSSKAIITVSLLHKETKSTYVPGSYGYSPAYTYYGRFWGYYSFWYPTIVSPGYYTQDKIYYMETNVYNAGTEELVWSAQSETYNPDNLSGFSSELANIIADKLMKDGMVSPPGIKVDRPGKNLSSRNY
jgi:hypothetical protein